ncbi:MAG: hypothetical protein IPP37_10990 [Saprospiraceae bacterium]|nr:hypothetical protein [Saprospiraceae bacterium]
MFYLRQGTVASCQVALEADVPVEEVEAGTPLPPPATQVRHLPSALPYLMTTFRIRYWQAMQSHGGNMFTTAPGRHALLTRMRTALYGQAMVLTMDKAITWLPC